MANNDRVKNLESCLDEVTSDLEVLAITGFPESGGWSKISKHCWLREERWIAKTQQSRLISRLPKDCVN